MIKLTGLKITKPGQLGRYYTEDDGIGMYDGNTYTIKNCVIDMQGQDCDEALAITWGSAAIISQCKIRNAKKLILCGSGDSDKHYLELGRRVVFDRCIIENFGRRGPEAQSGMEIILSNCLIKNWGHPDYFSVRSFGAWAHHGGKITAENCVFWQDHFNFSLKDIIFHISQAIIDEGVLALFKPSTYLPGCCRGLVSSCQGKVAAKNCYNNKWWIRLENRKGEMSYEEAVELIYQLRSM